MDRCRRALAVLLMSSLAACHAFGPRAAVRLRVAAPGVPADGAYDNHEQVWTARGNPAVVAPPHVVAQLGPTPVAGWSTLRVHLDATPPMDALWAMQRIDGAGAAAGWLPYRAIVADPATGATFDVRQWAALEACTLRGASDAKGLHVAADVTACSALTPGIGPEAAMLPIAIDAEGEWLRLRLFSDQARGTDARENARRVEIFSGWAAVNGAGPGAAADSNDWHMDRAIRLGSEGGRQALTWRDAKPSGYSLVLERLTYREGNVPVLKLSVVEDATGRTLAYAWANPEATRIGINLGWVQVGLQRASDAADH